MYRVLVPVLLMLGLLGCTKPPPQKADPAAAPVMVATSVSKTVPVQVRTIGTVKAVATVAIRPRVGGQITEVFFREGEDVRKDQKLLVIDPRPFEVAVKSAEAALAKAMEVQSGAERELKRLQKVGVASGVELDMARTAAESAKATVLVERAALDSAKLQLGFTTITSPIDGRVGELLVNRGNLVDANGPNPLVVINQVSPIHVAFALPEPYLPAVASARRQAPLKVEAFPRNAEPPVEGKLAFIDNAVSASSGTVLLKAEFPNLDRKLWPGQFVDVVLTVRDRPDSVVVPTAAVQTGQKGTYLFVLTPEKTVEMRSVVVAFEQGDEAVIESGLSAGETVVTEGQLRLIAGSKVDVKSRTAGTAEKSE